jgi:hypothetical protein
MEDGMNEGMNERMNERMNGGMDDERFDQLLDRAGATYRIPADPPIEEMWHSIEMEMRTARPGITRRSVWVTSVLAAAATLVLGIGIGRATAPHPVGAAVQMTADRTPDTLSQVASLHAPLQRATSSYLGETEALLREVKRGAQGTYAAQATTLLVTTRLLLDSPAATDARLRDLLEDLELVLAQIAAIEPNGSSQRNREEMQLIQSALDQRDVVPRLRTAVVTLASYED